MDLFLMIIIGVGAAGLLYFGWYWPLSRLYARIFVLHKAMEAQQRAISALGGAVFAEQILEREVTDETALRN